MHGKHPVEYPHHLLHKVPADLSQFWVILVASNPARYKRRYELCWRTIEMVEQAGVNYVLVELQQGHREFMLTRPDCPNHLQLRTVDELWHKENLVNLGRQHAKKIGKVREVAWIDMDCRPAMPYREWFEETWHQLQTYQFVQMWEYLIDLDNNHNPLSKSAPPNPPTSFCYRGFMANYILTGQPNVVRERKLVIPGGSEESGYIVDGTKSATEIISWGAPGLAWAANNDALDAIGGLMDFSILGANDWYTAHCLIGSVTPNKFDWVGNRYVEKIMHYQTLCERWIKRDVGYVPGIVYHDAHGDKKNRFYTTRGKILEECGYDPNTDIKYDAQGVLQLETHEPRQIRMRDLIRGYFRARNEDQLV